MDSDKFQILEKALSRLNEIKSPLKPKAVFPSQISIKHVGQMAHFILLEGNKLINQKNAPFPIIAGIKSTQEELKAVVVRFLSDLDKFSTEYGLSLTERLHWSQAQISSNALYNLARASLLPTTYESIDLLSNDAYYNQSSVPHKLRLAIELKIKSMIGFAKIEKIEKNGQRREVTFPTSAILNALTKSEVIDIACDPSEIKKIYEWACGFTHTGRSDFIWMDLIAFNYLSPIFDGQGKLEKISSGDACYNYIKSGQDIFDLERELNNLLRKKQLEILLLPEFMESQLSFYDSLNKRYI
jgi:hypothetical protein